MITASSALPTASAFLMLLFAGCREEPVATDNHAGQMVYVDLETKLPLVAAAGDAPAVHPVTGRRTLMPALYCPMCQKWHPSPPIDQLQRTRGAAVCPQDNTPLIIDGPWPE